MLHAREGPTTVSSCATSSVTDVRQHTQTNVHTLDKHTHTHECTHACSARKSMHAQWLRSFIKSIFLLGNHLLAITSAGLMTLIRFNCIHLTVRGVNTAPTLLRTGGNTPRWEPTSVCLSVYDCTRGKRGGNQYSPWNSIYVSGVLWRLCM